MVPEAECSFRPCLISPTLTRSMGGGTRERGRRAQYIVDIRFFFWDSFLPPFRRRRHCRGSNSTLFSHDFLGVRGKTDDAKWRRNSRILRLRWRRNSQTDLTFPFSAFQASLIIISPFFFSRAFFSAFGMRGKAEKLFHGSPTREPNQLQT